MSDTTHRQSTVSQQSHLTRNRSFWRQISSQAIDCTGTDYIEQPNNTHTTNQPYDKLALVKKNTQKAKAKPTGLSVPVRTAHMSIHNTAQNSSDNLPSYPPDNHHSLKAVYWTGGEIHKEQT